jgi:glutathione S-transferase
VICEYLDEVHPPSLHPADPLRKAINRAWVEFSSELFIDLYRLMHAGEREEFEERRRGAREKLERLEEQLGQGPCFNGPCFSLVDAAVAPAFMRIKLMEGIRPLGLLEGLPKVGRWSECLLERESVRNSVVPEFGELFRGYVAAGGSYLARGHG